MAGYHLDNRLAQDIVTRTMQIIDSNINVMDSRGRIIGSGDEERLGEMHEGALLAISQGRVVDIDDAVARHLHGVRPGINLPLRLDGQIVGVIGLTGNPSQLRQYGELVCMTAEMMLEQARLLHMLAQDSRLREELVLNLIRADELSPALAEWAQRLGVDLNQPRVAAVVEIDSGQLGVDSAMAELQQLQTLLTTPERDNLIATVSLTQMVVLRPALNSYGRWDPQSHRVQIENLLSRMTDSSRLRIRLALGNYFPDTGGIARSYRTAHTTMMVGKQRMPEQRSYFYQDLMLPVLLDSLRGGWQAGELVRPLARLKAMDNNGLLRRTLNAWFINNVQPSATAKALYIHRNTLEYRLNRISELTGLNLGSFDDRLLLYIALQLDGSEGDPGSGMR
ncbi:CdaR family transcriptional regulator [Enterobacillus tribolii]|uniref:CdaR family transcriptional regulator n=1 Tax=Enterobacillus tribolii TaxID=1487935 RepID=A0A370QU09_9GAMM|nr:CdaR family transcriptional regulator [Enterobacillus tribolii]MBW7981195.1 CdaR family transcriptional regulator [Enterobacillus tribolii]RDK92746.1 CdaR family transcriptional regulator [Enterobacillus tribolii]